ncbi:MAG: mitochondrial fission ELM1 family protein [Hyphomicrobiales bacterium]
MPSKTKTSPLVWVLQTSRVGDNAQAWALAKALGWETEVRSLRFNPLFAVPNVMLGSTLVTLDHEASDRLVAPWPDLVIGVGRRTVPVSRWIKANSNGKTKLVQLGRPRADNTHFDLVISSPQYRLSVENNVLHNLLPLPRHEADLPELETKYWLEIFKRFPQPWTGVFLGGAKWPFKMDPETIAAFANNVAKHDGSFLITTSPRTPPETASIIRKCMGERAFVHVWDGGMLNPYQAILNLANRFIVTGDSASMLSEACATGCEVEIFDLPSRQSAGVVIETGNVLAMTGLINPPRDMKSLHSQLFAAGHAAPLGQNGEIRAQTKAPNDLEKALQRVRELMKAAA